MAEEFFSGIAVDDELREWLKTDPTATLRQQGADIPPGMEVKVVESTADMIYFALPPRFAGSREQRRAARRRQRKTAASLLRRYSLTGVSVNKATFFARLAIDDELRAQMKDDPVRTLRREGATIADGVEVKVVESTADTMYIVLPPSNDAA
jgi:hypothetical protein